jgi:hypothetical protein
VAPETNLNEVERLAWTPMDAVSPASEQSATVDGADDTVFDYEDVRDYDLGEGD